MKKIFKSLIVLTAFAGLWSCEDEQDLQFAQPEGDFRILSPVSGEGAILSPLTPLNPALALTWEPMDYGTPTAVNYTVQVAMNGTDFAVPIDLVTTTNTFASVNSEALNGAAIASGLAADVESGLDIRIRSTVGTNNEQEAFSDVITYLVTPYVTYPFRDLFLVGDATAAGWGNDNNNYALSRDPDNEDIYYYTGYFAVGGFKVLENKGSWAPQYGTDGTASAVVPRPTEGDPDPSPFSIPTAGYYSFMINLADNTFTLSEYDATGAVSYTSIAIIGTATPNNWDDPDTDMTQSTFDPHIWYITNQFLKAGGELKFRANDTWDVNWGGGPAYSGITTINGGNIPIGIVADGNYDIWFNDITGRYIYIPAE